MNYLSSQQTVQGSAECATHVSSLGIRPMVCEEPEAPAWSPGLASGWAPMSPGPGPRPPVKQLSLRLGQVPESGRLQQGHGGKVLQGWVLARSTLHSAVCSSFVFLSVFLH